MLARNGVGPAHRADDGGPRKQNAIGERHQPSKTDTQSTQGPDLAGATQAALRVSARGLILKSSVRHVSAALRREESDHYARVVAPLNTKWRVIEARDAIQWILQVRRGQAWRNRYFCRSREGQVCCCHWYAGEISGDALVLLLRLPKFFGGAS